MDLSASLRLGHELLAVEREHTVQCLLELTAPPAPTGAERPRLHLALVIDRSGSMAGGKLASATACAAYLARRLNSDDHLAVVTYDDVVQLAWPLQTVAGQQEALAAALRTVIPGGSTNLSGGWLKGIEQLRSIPGGSGPKKVLLLTDGLANVGITEPAELEAIARRTADDSGVGTTTIGFGAGFDEDLLTAIADAGAGNAYFAETPDDAAGIFAQEFEGLVTLVAQNVSVEVRPTSDVQFLGVLNDHPIVSVPGGLQAQLGDAYGDERRRVVFEFRVPGIETLGVSTIAEVVVRYVSVGEAIAAHELRLPVTVNLVSADEAAAATPDQAVIDEVLVLKSARAQEEARRRAADGDFDGARELLKRTAEQLRSSSAHSDRADELLAQAEETEEHATLMEAELFDPTTSKRMKYSVHRRQRGRPQPPV